jgi:hypothetical protein
MIYSVRPKWLIQDLWTRSQNKNKNEMEKKGEEKSTFLSRAKRETRPLRVPIVSPLARFEGCGRLHLSSTLILGTAFTASTAAPRPETAAWLVVGVISGNV